MSTHLFYSPSSALSAISIQPRKVSQSFSLAIKRLMDIIFAVVGMLILSPVFLLVLILVKADSPGPIFYRGKRCGKGCKPFYILKFRTMYERPQSYDGPKVTGKDDARVTRVGRWLRQTKLNELPQLWNVLKGEMSLVGPRPEDYEIAQSWPQAVRDEVLSVRPGITSPASVLYRNEENLLASGSLMDTYLGTILPSKLRLDQLYVRHRSFLLDLDTILWTFLVLTPRLGNYAPPDHLLFIGPITRLIQRYLSWFVVDAIVAFLSVGMVGAIWRAYGPFNVGLLSSIGVAVMFSLMFSLSGALFRINRISWSRASSGDVFDLVPPMLIASTAAFLFNRFVRTPYAPDQPLFPEGMILASSAVTSLGLVLARYRSRVLSSLMVRLFSWQHGVLAAQERVLIVGGGEAAQFAAWWLQNGRRAQAFRIVGCVDDDLFKQGMRIHGMDVLGRCDDVPRLVAQHDVGILIFAIHNIENGERQRLLDLCQSTPAYVMEMPDILASLQSAAASSSGRTANGHIAPAHRETGKFRMLAEIPAAQVDAWLGELEKLAEKGDTLALQDRIRALRHMSIHRS